MRHSEPRARRIDLLALSLALLAGVGELLALQAWRLRELLMRSPQ